MRGIRIYPSSVELIANSKLVLTELDFDDKPIVFLKPEVRNWLIENFGKAGCTYLKKGDQYVIDGKWTTGRATFRSLFVRFNDSNDAMLFKLTWG